MDFDTGGTISQIEINYAYKRFKSDIYLPIPSGNPLLFLPARTFTILFL